MGIDAFFLPAVLGLGVVSTLQDHRVRRISNLWIIISLAYAILAHFILFVSADQQEIFWSLHSFVNVWVSAVIAVFFWKQNWWGGGDAKLFICYSALIPLSHYPFGYFGYYFPSFLILILTFVPAAIWTFIHAQYNLIKAGKSITDNFHPSKAHYWEFFELSLGFSAIFFLSNLLTLVLNNDCLWIRDFPIVLWLLSIGFYRTIFRLFHKRLWLVLVSWALGFCAILFVPFYHQINIGQILMKSFTSWLLVFILRLYIFRTIDFYVDTTKNNHMAFAGWMFLGALAVWFSKTAFWLMRFNHFK